MSYTSYHKYKNSGIEWLGDIPDHWITTKIKFMVKNTKGSIKTGPFGSDPALN